MDFKDYQARERAESGNKTELKNVYLDNIFKNFFNSIGLENLAAEIPNL